MDGLTVIGMSSALKTAWALITTLSFEQIGRYFAHGIFVNENFFYSSLPFMFSLQWVYNCYRITRIYKVKYELR